VDLARIDVSSREQIERRLSFEVLLSDLSARLLIASPQEVDKEIERGLDEVRRFFQCDRGGLLCFSDDGKRVLVTHISCGEGIPPVPGDLNLLEIFPWAYEQLIVLGRPIIMTRLEDLPSEAERDRQAWASMETCASLDIPLLANPAAHYIISMQYTTHEFEWPEEYISRLRLFGELCINALSRKKADYALRESEERLTLATDAGGIGLWAMDFDTRMVWVSDKTRQLFHFLPDEEISYQHFIDAIYPDDRQMVGENVERVLKKEADLFVEYRVLLPDGNIRWILSRGSFEGASLGHSPRLIGVSVDITGRKRTEAELQNFGGRLIHAAEKERAHLAREIHDDFNQRLALLGMELDILGQDSPVSEEALKVKLTELSSVVKDLSADMQRLSRQLHPAKLTQLGLVASLQSLCKEITERSSTRVEFFAGDVPRHLPACVSICLYRIAQEALNNVVRHSGARQSQVMLSAV
jgi:PAS domain S-box-containing protein